MKNRLLSLLFGAGSAVSGGSFVLLDSLRLGGDAKMIVSGEKVNTAGKDWVKIGGTGEGIYIEREVKSRPGGIWRGRYVGGARVGSGGYWMDGRASELADENMPVMIWAGEKGLAIMRLKRYFEDQKGEEALKRARKVNDDMWNKGTANGQWKDEGGDYFCNERTNGWKNYLNEKSDIGIGYVKKKGVTGPGRLSLVEKHGNQYKLVNTVMKTSCKGTEIIYVEKISLLGNHGKEEIDCTNSGVTGKLLKLGKVSSVLYGKNKDLKVTERGIEDGNGNRIEWGTHFLPKLNLQLAE